jgi:hypothetical protein
LFVSKQSKVAMGQGLSIPMPLEEVRNDYGFSSEDDHGIFREDHRSYEARHDALAEVISNNVKMVLESCEAAGETLEVSEPPAPKKSRKAKYVCTYVDDDGVRRRLHPKMTQWYNIYIEQPDIDDVRFQNQFRRRFRLPHAQFVELCAMLETSD